MSKDTSQKARDDFMNEVENISKKSYLYTNMTIFILIN